MKLIDQIKKLSSASRGGRVRIADVKRETGASDADLLNLQNAGAIVLFRLDDPSEITDEDKRAAINLGNGIVRHILYVNSFS